MNPNVMAPAAPGKLMQDVMPPYAPAMPEQPKPAEPVAVQPTVAPVDPMAAAPVAEVAPVTQPAEIPVALPASEPVQPMFPVQTEIQADPAPTVAAPIDVPADPVPTPPAQPQPPVPEVPQTAMAQPAHHSVPARKTNWMVIALALVVAGALLYAAMVAFRTSS